MGEDLAVERDALEREVRLNQAEEFGEQIESPKGQAGERGEMKILAARDVKVINQPAPVFEPQVPTNDPSTTSLAARALPYLLTAALAAGGGAGAGLLPWLLSPKPDAPATAPAETKAIDWGMIGERVGPTKVRP
jgi:hypothetical protein